MSPHLPQYRTLLGPAKIQPWFRSYWLCLIAVSCLGTTNGFAQVDSFWTNSAGGNWAVDSNWSTVDYPNANNPNPGDTYNATFNLTPGSLYTIQVDTPITIENLTLDSADAFIFHSGGTLTANGLINLNSGTYWLRGGTIANSTINQSGGTLTFGSFFDNILDNTTVTGGLSLTSINSSGVRFTNGGTYTGDATVNTSNSLIFEGSSGGSPPSAFTLDNGGTVNLAGGRLGVSGNIDLTVGSTMTIRGRGTISKDTVLTGDGTVVNQGIIKADLVNASLSIDSDQFTNQGTVRAESRGVMVLSATDWENQSTIEAVGNSKLSFRGNWVNSGTVSIDNSTLDLLGNFASSDIGTINRTGTTSVNVRGNWDNSGSTYTLDASTGDFFVDSINGGRISGGTIEQAGGKLLFSSNTSNVFNGTTVNGGLDLSVAQSRVRFFNGATFNGDANVTGTSSRLIFEGSPNNDPVVTRTLDNSSTIHLNNDGHFGTSGNIDLTLGSTVTVRGTGSIESDLHGIGDSTIINQGLVTADISGERLVIQPDQFINQGTLRAENGGELEIGGATWDNQGAIEATGGSTLLLGGVPSTPMTIWSNNGTVSIDNSTLIMRNFKTSDIGTISRTGTTTVQVANWDNSNTIFTLDSTTGDYLLGSVSGGTINQAGGELLFGTGFAIVDGTTINGDLNLSNSNAAVRLQNGATFNGDANLTGLFSQMFFTGSSGADPPIAVTLDNGGTINLGQFASFGAGGNLDLTLGSTMTVRGRGSIKSDSPLFGDSTIINQGTVTGDVSGIRLSVSPDAFINEGLVQTTGGGGLTLNNYVQTTGTTRLDGGEVRSTSTILDLQGGSLEGNGLIRGEVFSNAVLSPGLMGAGELNFVWTSSEFGTSSEWQIELGGINDGEFDLVTFSGDVVLDGLLDVGLINGFVLGPNQEFVFGEIGGTATGMFAGLNEGDIVASFGDYHLVLTYAGGDGNDLAFNTSAVPEPGSIAFVGLGILGLLIRRPARLRVRC